MNILFLGGAKRVSMARMFKAAAKARGESCEIFSYELSKHVAISAVAKVIVGKSWSDPTVCDDIIRVAKANNISIVVPFVDGAVSVAARLPQLSGNTIFVPSCDADGASDMFDKAKAALIFEQAGLPIPATYSIGQPISRLIAKPRKGSASKGIIFIDDEAALSKIDDITEYIIQERIDRRVEYTVDCYVSVTKGRIQAIVPRKRIEVSGGEVTHTETVICPEGYDLAKLTLEKLGLRGAVTIQIMHDLDTDRYLLMEINPRLGGGAVCSVYAGVNLPDLIMSDASGEDREYVCYRPNTEIVRYQQELAFFN